MNKQDLTWLCEKQTPEEIDYIIVKSDTDEIIDDAQGYGYKSVKKAYAAFWYKNRSPEEKNKEKMIQNWIRSHEKFCDDMSDEIFYNCKDVPDFKVDAKFVEMRLKESNLQMEGFTPNEFLKVWKRFKG
jgi:hypothetical protein